MGTIIVTISILASLLWGFGSARRLLQMKRRVMQDWEAVCWCLHERGRLLFQLGAELEEPARQQVLEAHEKLIRSLNTSPFHGSLEEARLAEQAVQRGLQPLNLATQSLQGAADRLSFACETYNDGVRLLKRLKRSPLHLPIACLFCPRKIDLFETGCPVEGGVVKLDFNP